MGELEPIRLQRDSSHGRAPRAPSSRTRKRDADKKVRTFSIRALEVCPVCIIDDGRDATPFS